MKYSQVWLTVREHTELKRYCAAEDKPIQSILQDIYTHAIKNLDDYDPAEIRDAQSDDAGKSLMFHLKEEDHKTLNLWLAEHDVKKKYWNRYVFKRAYESQIQGNKQSSLADIIHAEIERTRAGGKRAEMEQVREYVTAHHNGLPLVARDLKEDYRIICEYGSHVLAGLKYGGGEAAHGYQFATWQYANNKQAVEMGHYYPTWQFGTNALDIAKEDFSVRSGLFNSDQIFAPELLAEMHRALGFYIQESPDLTGKQEEKMEKAMEQIEGLLPEAMISQEPQQGPSMSY